MSPFSLTASAVGPFRTMAIEVAGKYLDMAGGSAADVATLTGQLATTLDEVTSGAADDETVRLQFEPDDGRLAVTVLCGSRRSVVHHALMAKKG